jgi:dihydrofolate reductase
VSNSRRLLRRPYDRQDDEQEAVMRRVIESTLVSADGVIGEPHLWTGEHFGEQAVAHALERLRDADAMVMGRRTYEMFSQIWATPDNEYAAAIYELRKYVFSSTVERADWNNTEVVRSDIASAVGELKRREGKDIVLYGHGPVGQALLEAGLLDELNLWIHPVVVGSGALLFREGARTELRLTATKTTETGVAILSYEPVR